ncbi:MAG TPA: hypothetical protein VJN43_10445 [Bryobacteraceae bacterium]|nr:hypothetical protein [Bryobacteraceae bacterium]
MIRLLFVVLAAAIFAQPAIDPGLAAQYFDQAAAACHADNGTLWGVSLCGPMLFADPATHSVVTNQADGEGKLTRSGAVFTGQLPAAENIANTAFNWAGIRWTMVAWPLPEDPRARQQLMMHEVFHRVQESLGFPMTAPSNAHLDTIDGRVWLRLEWRALKRAVTAIGDARRQAIKDALVFRTYRRSIFTEAGNQERELEMSEGLAEYTGVKLSGRSDAEMRHSLAAQIERAEGGRTFVRSFSYESGPAYGVLLDDSGSHWRSGLKPANDLGDMLAKAFSIELPGDLHKAAEAGLARYDGEALRAEERAREKRRQKSLRDYQARLVDSPVLVIRLRKMNIQFDPNEVTPLGEHGTVYPHLRVTDEWGALTASRGALVSSDWTQVTLPAPARPEAVPLEGDGWKLELKPGWKLERGKRPGDYTLARFSRDSSARLRSSPQR